MCSIPANGILSMTGSIETNVMEVSSVFLVEASGGDENEGRDSLPHPTNSWRNAVAVNSRSVRTVTRVGVDDRSVRHVDAGDATENAAD